MALLIDKWDGAAPLPPRSPLTKGMQSWLGSNVPGLAAGVLSLWRKDRNPDAESTVPAAAVRSEPEPPPESDNGADGRRQVFDDGPIGIAVLDPADRLLQSSAAFQALVGSDRAADGQPLDTILRATDGSDLGDSLATDGTITIDVTIIPADKEAEERSGNLLAAPLEGGTRVVHLIETTRQKKLELQFTQSQKMLAVGTLAGGIAHDFNNLLTAMNGFCDLLLQRHQPGDPSFADIMQVKQNANRAANLVRQLLAFSRQQTLQLQVLSLPDVIADLSSLLRRPVGRRHRASGRAWPRYRRGTGGSWPTGAGADQPRRKCPGRHE